ncbi:PEP-CTERM sorting domain-containing protein [Fuerstiella marisgermanici]
MPEPSSTALLAVIGIGFVVIRRHRSKMSQSAAGCG